MGNSRSEVWAIVVAAGRGSRFGSQKQFAPLGGRSVLEWSLDAARSFAAGVVLVLPPGQLGACPAGVACTVAGGATRAESVRAGLAAVPGQAEVVLVHDAARPLSAPETWSAVLEAVLAGADGAVPCLPVTDTIKQLNERGELVTLDRARLLAAQTPQAFRASALRRAHSGAGQATDDAGLVEEAGGRVVAVPGHARNLKITDRLDLLLAEQFLAASDLR